MEVYVKGFNVVDNVNHTNKSSSKVFWEEKQCRLPFRNVGNKGDILLKAVHTDIYDPMEVATIGGSRYYLLCAEDYRLMAFIYYIKNCECSF